MNLIERISGLKPDTTIADFSNEDLSQSLSLELREAFKKLPSTVTHVNLCNTNLFTVAHLAKTISGLPSTVTHLDLSSNQLGKKSVDGLCEFFKAIPPHLTVNLRDNKLFENLSMPACHAILEAFPADKFGKKDRFIITNNGWSDYSRALPALVSLFHKMPFAPVFLIPQFLGPTQAKAVDDITMYKEQLAERQMAQASTTLSAGASAITNTVILHDAYSDGGEQKLLQELEKLPKEERLEAVIAKDQSGQTILHRTGEKHDLLLKIIKSLYQDERVKAVMERNAAGKNLCDLFFGECTPSSENSAMELMDTLPITDSYNLESLEFAKFLWNSLQRINRLPSFLLIAKQIIADIITEPEALQIDVLKIALESLSDDERLKAIDTILCDNYNKPEVSDILLEPMIKTLSESNRLELSARAHRRSAIETLRKINKDSPTDIQKAVEYLNDSDPDIQLEASDRLSRFKNDPAVISAVRLMSRQSPGQLKESARQLLFKWGYTALEKKALDALSKHGLTQDHLDLFSTFTQQHCDTLINLIETRELPLATIISQLRNLNEAQTKDIETAFRDLKTTTNEKIVIILLENNIPIDLAISLCKQLSLREKPYPWEILSFLTDWSKQSDIERKELLTQFLVTESISLPQAINKIKMKLETPVSNSGKTEDLISGAAAAGPKTNAPALSKKPEGSFASEPENKNDSPKSVAPQAPVRKTDDLFLSGQQIKNFVDLITCLDSLRSTDKDPKIIIEYVINSKKIPTIIKSKDDGTSPVL
jgi:hypothetical protein